MPRIGFTDNEVQQMKLSVQLGHDSWKHSRLNSIKDKIKNQHLYKQDHCCCYCSRELWGEFRLVIDIEHIIPKSLCVNHMFTPKNLSVACKRCNMNIKRADISFIEGPLSSLPNQVFRSRYYKFIHPNLDKFDAHLQLHIHRLTRTKKLIKYQVINSSRKGQFNYDYFMLNRLELNAFDEAQDASRRIEILDADLATRFAELEQSLR